MTESLLRNKIVPIPTPGPGERENRDAGRSYLITEMPALKAERWARHAIGAMSRQDLNVREEFGKLGMLGFYLLGLQALAGGDMPAVDELMDEMLTCIKIIESPTVLRPLGGDGDIWEVSTIYLLRKELIELHMGFTFAELALILMAAASAQQPDLPNTQTSQTSSET
jgi:hypothetical protein